MSTIIETILRLHDSEINTGFETMWDGLVTVYLGDSMNGRSFEHTLELSLLSDGYASGFLEGAACQQFPNSKFARECEKRTTP